MRDEFWRSAFLTHFWSQNGLFSRHFGIFHGPKRVTTSSKWAENTCLSTVNGPKSLFEALLTLFWSKNSQFHGILGFSMAQNASPRAQNGLKTLEHPEWSKSTFGSVFDPFLVPKRPLFKACWDFPRAKTRQHGYKMGKKQFLENPEWCGVIFGEARFDRFLTHFSSQNRVFQGILGFSIGQNASPRAQNWPKTLV